ncbi:hypothetical protein PFICI_04622 [Pestalotiopsis fici W106-1]|uniref:C2H2-type domain-containing protein n=1 Tax=Pestalotiopsis fici (strain W106-1 / CGMCC3.15140) TaxID=1229662 RepID=W3XC69_PESFW|nr:uncharacterized protein PFICI_04622 [Pestalotiopsis fici W106-1]ETS82746.1 hypothetical protein PFICI_04622 [Pestalotiopsis fici W106-1]
MAQRLIERACDQFRKELSPEDENEIISTKSLDEVKLALGQIERHLAARQSLRNFDRIAPFLGAAERFSQVVEVVCNGTPYLPWIWAPVKFIIQSARDHVHVLDKVLMAYANIGNSMPRLSRYGEVFHDHAFQCMIAYLFEDILEFHREAYSMLKKPGWTIFFSSSWGRFDHRFSSLLINIERLSEQIDREAVALDIVATAEWRSKSADDASKREEQWQTQQLHAILNWLGIEDDIQEAKLEMNANKCYDGTCQWLTKSSKIRTWLERNRGNPVLWLNGKPGSGKSILSSMLIRFLRSDPSRRIIRMAPDLVPYVYDECLVKAQRCSSDVLKRIMPQLFSRFDDVNLVVDGIDELPSSEHKSIITALLQLSKSCSGVKLLLVSQDLPTIADYLSKKPTLCLREEAEATHKDHAIMVEGSLKELNEKRRGAIGGVLMEKLKNEILDKSEGMFLWVNLVMNLLKMSKSPQELRQQIFSLPTSLAEIYQKILSNICHQLQANAIPDVMRIFAWLKCHKGQQPMLKCEVRLAMALDGSTRKITRDSLPWANATDICKPLIEDGPDNTLVFVHSTVPQYYTQQCILMFLKADRMCRFLFENGPNSFMSVPAAIASVTFACICQVDQALDLLQPQCSTSTSTLEVARGFYGLLPYSYQYWTQHLIEFLSMSEKEPSSFSDSLSKAIMECLKQLCQKLMGTPDMDSVPIKTDEDSSLLQRFLTVDEAAVITQTMERAKQLQSQGTKPVTAKLDTPSASLQEYRRALHHIVRQDSMLGIEQDELIAFKEDYKPTAFVCDRQGCNRSLRGYSSKEKLASHRERHTQSLRCYERDCQYNDVGFSTGTKLKNHKQKMHPGPTLVPILEEFPRETSPMMHSTGGDQQAGAAASEILESSSLYEPANPQSTSTATKEWANENEHPSAVEAFPSRSKDLPGQRPTRILIGCWSRSSSRKDQDKHACYGILGANAMFRIKLVRETMDGRFVDGNFPTAASARWIGYEEVNLLGHIRDLSRYVMKEYVRVRQYQIDHCNETEDERVANEIRAVDEAHRRRAALAVKA